MTKLPSNSRQLELRNISVDREINIDVGNAALNGAFVRGGKEIEAAG